MKPFCLDDESPSRVFVANKENKSYSPPSCAKSFKYQLKDFPEPPPSTSKGKSSTGNYQFNKSNIRACSIPQPRAVLSSPDNDEMIGHQNQLSGEKQTPQKKTTSNQKIQTRSKTGNSAMKNQGSNQTRKTMQQSGSSSHHSNQKHTLHHTTSRQSTIKRG